MTVAGIEPATFRFVAQHLNHCATAVPENFREVTKYCYEKLSSHFSIHFDQMVYWLFDVNTYVHTRVCAGVLVSLYLYIHGSYGLLSPTCKQENKITLRFLNSVC